MFDIDADCDDSRKQELIEMAQAYSPVFDMLSHGLPVSCRLDDDVKKSCEFTPGFAMRIPALFLPRQYFGF